MIQVKLMGGLGNQLFQYAIGRYLALSYDTTLNLDTSFYDNQVGVTKRICVLDKFYLPEGRVSFQTQIMKYGYKEKSLPYDMNIKLLPNNISLEGYFLSYKYWDEIIDVLREELMVKPAICGNNLEMKKRILSSHSVAVHIRRGDYAQDPKTQVYHGLITLDKWNTNLEEMRCLVDSPTFFIFSDDIEWCKKSLAGDDLVFVDCNNDDTQYEDFRLMTFCQHFIISNSTFSLWAAYLNTNKDKIVMAPNKWFNNPLVKYDICDILRPEWILF